MKIKEWWNAQYATDQAAMISIVFGLVVLVISAFVIVGGK